ncbi:FAD-dependent oxidoreductase [Aneurinibacillus sp. Ricciae_BoGa-3]|uniref:NAD(P)/FAD-dependent oxidoreductase n=1 Tax=Aneurinibacillus sp. Ricciae_BoGa-3 TaxID=3022697 RepID=UPI002340125C|nr:FAD-dependent oxidoreductase [Aneurinibacillus sp. Ricciae_BoGa-3]WCK52373.1 FAD-dependent oxidoreductase [Aneurinibacillus sp. Ricciae_BoGa-3]
MGKEIVLLGAGYGGVSFLNTVIPYIPPDIHIKVIDRLNHHAIKPEFYALASGSLNENKVKARFPSHPQVEYIQDEAEEIQIHHHKVICAQQEVSFEQLIVSLGCVDNYFNVPWAEEYTNSIQTFAKAIKTRKSIDNLPANSHLVIVGGGLSGVELASDLSEQHSEHKITLLERSNEILPTLPERIQRFVRSHLEDQKIDVLTNISVTMIDEKAVYYAGGTLVPYDLCVWAAGIMPHPVSNPLLAYSNADRLNRIVVKDNYELPYYNDIFVIGDCASSAFAPSAQLAHLQGKQLGEYFLSVWQGKEYVAHSLKLKGVLGYLGKKTGFGMINSQVLLGKIPHVIKSGVLWMHKNHSG